METKCNRCGKNFTYSEFEIKKSWLKLNLVTACREQKISCSVICPYCNYLILVKENEQ